VDELMPANTNEPMKDSAPIGGADGFPLQYAREGRIHRRAALGAILSAIGTAGVAAAYYYLDRTRALVSAPVAAPLIIAATQPSNPAKPQAESVEKIYREAIAPRLDEFDQRNANAADHAMGVLHDRIAMHRAGVEPFTKDVASWHTRFGVLRRYPADLWHRLRHQPPSSTSVSEYVNEKFRRGVLSEETLNQDVAAVLSNFNEDMLASQNRLYSELSLPLSRIRTSRPIMTPAMAQFRQDVQQRAAQMTHSLAPDTLVSGLAAVAGGWVATDVAQALTTRIVTQILAQLGTAMAAEGIEAGGATIGGAAAGGGTGSFGGPVGTIIGIGVGLIVGAIVDWRLSKKFEAKVAEQCNRFLDSLEQRLADGTDSSPGLKRVLNETATVTGQAQREAIRAALKEIKE
jgi:hypothetical protein